MSADAAAIAAATRDAARISNRGRAAAAITGGLFVLTLTLTSNSEQQQQCQFEQLRDAHVAYELGWISHSERTRLIDAHIRNCPSPRQGP